MSARGGLVELDVHDASGNPITLEMADDELVGYTSSCREDRLTTLHRLDAARFAECGSRVGEVIAADEVTNPSRITLCWYCFPRG